MVRPVAGSNGQTGRRAGRPQGKQGNRHRGKHRLVKQRRAGPRQGKQGNRVRGKHRRGNRVRGKQGNRVLGKHRWDKDRRDNRVLGKRRRVGQRLGKHRRGMHSRCLAPRRFHQVGPYSCRLRSSTQL